MQLSDVAEGKWLGALYQINRIPFNKLEIIRIPECHAHQIADVPSKIVSAGSGVSTVVRLCSTNYLDLQVLKVAAGIWSP
jgi:hypothetical protein